LYGFSGYATDTYGSKRAALTAGQGNLPKPAAQQSKRPFPAKPGRRIPKLLKTLGKGYQKVCADLARNKRPNSRILLGLLDKVP